MPKYYAVRTGRNVGIYNSWAECKEQVHRYPGARYKSFQSSGEAKAFVNGGSGHTSYSSSRVPYSNPCTYSSSYSKPRSYSNPYSNTYSYSDSCSSNSATSHPPRPVVYSDGCCYRNGQRNPQAGVGVYWGNDSPYNVSEKLSGYQTNQRAELTAAYKAVQGAIDQGFSSVEVKTDSSYTIKALTEWLPKWERNGWKTVQGEDVKNRADLEQLSEACKNIDVKWTHVAGHQGIAGNEYADQLAKQGSQK